MSSASYIFVILNILKIQSNKYHLSLLQRHPLHRWDRIPACFIHPTTNKQHNDGQQTHTDQNQKQLLTRIRVALHIQNHADQQLYYAQYCIAHTHRQRSQHLQLICFATSQSNDLIWWEHVKATSQ